MGLYSRADKQAAGAIAELCYTNPFSARRIELEREALGPGFVEGPALWSRASLRFKNPNVPGLRERARALLSAGHAALERGKEPSEEERRLHAGVVRYHLFDRFDEELSALCQGVVDARREDAGAGGGRVGFYGDFRQEAERYYGVRQGLFAEQLDDVPHLFATSVQVRLAFTLIFQNLLGSSSAAARLRAATWQSVFTHDMRRYERGMFERMYEIPTLVLGASGTGKELVARAVGLSSYVPFEGDGEKFASALAGDFRAVNLTALSPTLIESELFGHVAGAFTGATAKREGMFERCGPSGSVFLDELGELSADIQVKLLRVLQSRRFEPVGDAEPLEFEGRVIAATNRDMASELSQGSFRSDLYYRLCGHTIRTPSFAEQLAEAPEDLGAFVELVVPRVLGDKLAERDPEDTRALCEQVVQYIDAHLGRDYAWPGNVRELEQCVRSFVVQRDYVPQPRAARASDAADVDAVLGGLDLPAEALLDRYVAALFARHGSLQAVAEIAGVHRHTVRARLAAARKRMG